MSSVLIWLDIHDM